MSSTTGYFLTDDGVLRHGHPSRIDLGKEQWHDADSVHRNDPDAHERQHSFEPDLVRWSPRNRHLTSAEREQLILDAKDRHDDAVYGRHSQRQRRYCGHSKSQYDTVPEPAVPTEPEPAAPSLPSSPSSDGDTDEMLQLFNLMDGNIKRIERTANDASRDATDALTKTEQLDLSLNELRSNATSLIDRVETLEQASVRKVEYVIHNNGHSKTVTGTQHFMFPVLLALASSLELTDRNIWITGPAGSGKTTAAKKLADALSLTYEFMPSIDTPYKLSGFIDAGGTYHTTAFRRIYENGGVILLDEVDGSSPGAMLEINGALSGPYASFPDGMVKRHDDCYVIAAANTWGHGGDANYVGRYKQDAASLDRFVTLHWPYDEVLETIVAGGTVTNQRSHTPVLFTQDSSPEETQSRVEAWIKVVQTVRQAAVTDKAQVVISPRASIKGAQLLRAQLHPRIVVDAIFGRYSTVSTWPRWGKAAEEFAASASAAPAPVTNGASHTEPSKLHVDFSKAKVYGN